MSDPNELTRWDKIVLEAGATCLILETRNGLTSAAWELSATEAFAIIENARLQAEMDTRLSTSVFDRWLALREGKL
jgi:hypothetical protein